MGRFCKFQKSKTVNYNLQGGVAQTGHIKINVLDGGVLINGSNLFVKEKLSKVLKYFLLGLAMPPNGPAIKRTERKVPTSDVGIARSQPAGQACYPTRAPAWSRYFSQKIVTPRPARTQ
jgi:hypothetical protein